MKKWIIMLLTLWLLTVPVRGADIPDELWKALPEEAEQFIAKDVGETGWTEGLAHMGAWAMEQGGKLLRVRVRGAASILLVVVLCGAVESFGGKAAVYVPMAGGLAVTLLTAGDLGELIGLGNSTIREMSAFSKVLLPTLAAATAVSGSAATASMLDVDYTAKTVALVVAARDRAYARLQEAGIEVLKSATNFLFVKAGEDAAPVQKALREEGILVRHFGSQRLKSWLRVTIGTTEDMEKVTDALIRQIKGE